MKSARRANGPAFIMPIVMTAFALVFVALGWAYYDYDKTVLRFPILVASIIVVLCVWLCLGLWRHGAQVIEKESIQPSLMAFIWVGAAIPSVLLFGFGCGLPLYTAVYLKAQRASWPLTVALSALVFAVAVLLFGFMLHVPLPLWPVFMR